MQNFLNRSFAADNSILLSQLTPFVVYSSMTESVAGIQHDQFDQFTSGIQNNRIRVTKGIAALPIRLSTRIIPSSYENGAKNTNLLC